MIPRKEKESRTVVRNSSFHETRYVKIRIPALVLSRHYLGLGFDKLGARNDNVTVRYDSDRG